ncbi:hypothetical protein BS17DRAFT_468253 [Gyrodon lividus]|nr:hypothetical protein BS17DRAFT_468253 [Gyrodon lividus]
MHFKPHLHVFSPTGAFSAPPVHFNQCVFSPCLCSPPAISSPTHLFTPTCSFSVPPLSPSEKRTLPFQLRRTRIYGIDYHRWIL